eukprot:1815532-Pleurochrysis_carterae.AAC.7
MDQGGVELCKQSRAHLDRELDAQMRRGGFVSGARFVSRAWRRLDLHRQIGLAGAAHRQTRRGRRARARTRVCACTRVSSDARLRTPGRGRGGEPVGGAAALSAKTLVRVRVRLGVRLRVRVKVRVRVRVRVRFGLRLKVRARVRARVKSPREKGSRVKAARDEIRAGGRAWPWPDLHRSRADACRTQNSELAVAPAGEHPAPAAGSPEDVRVWCCVWTHGGQRDSEDG